MGEKADTNPYRLRVVLVAYDLNMLSRNRHMFMMALM